MLGEPVTVLRNINTVCSDISKFRKSLGLNGYTGFFPGGKAAGL